MKVSRHAAPRYVPRSKASGYSFLFLSKQAAIEISSINAHSMPDILYAVLMSRMGIAGRCLEIVFVQHPQYFKLRYYKAFPAGIGIGFDLVTQYPFIASVFRFRRFPFVAQDVRTKHHFHGVLITITVLVIGRPEG